MALGNPLPLLLSTVGDYEIKRSLRFNDGDSPDLSRTPGSAGNRRTYTISVWVKIGLNGTYRAIIGAGGGTNRDRLQIFNDNKIVFNLNDSTDAYLRTDRLVRDPNAWMHIVVGVDTTQGTASNRIKLYVNGVQETSFASETYPSQNYDCRLNNNIETFIGQSSSDSLYFDGYIAEFNFIDGTQLTPSSFGETNEDTGQWVPKKYAGSYGSQGWYLNFSDNSGTTATTLGKDYSGNGNNFTPNNFSVAAGGGNDSLEDTPTNNFAVLNTLIKDKANISNGSLDFDTAQGDDANSSFGLSSGKWYCEVTNGAGDNGLWVGIKTKPNFRLGTSSSHDSGPICVASSADAEYHPNSTAAVTTGGGWTTNDKIGIALDATNKTCDIYKNGSKIYGFTSFTLAGPYFFVFDRNTSSGATSTHSVNFGQRPFSHQVAGYEAVCTANLPEPTILKGTDHFNTVLWTGNDANSHAITGVGFQPDLVWNKGRDDATYHNMVQDSVRGTQKFLKTDSSDAETTNSANSGLLSFDSDGFTVGYGTQAAWNKSGKTFVAWNWKGGGGGSSNTTGDINSTVSANPSAGFSIVGYQGNGTAGQSIGHGMGVAPEIIFFKNRSSNSRNWEINYVNHDDGSYDYFYLNLTVPIQGGSLGISTPTSSVFEVTAGNDANQNGHDHVAYCFSSVEGYSKIGIYKGNGNADGTFVYTGFRPALLINKALSFDKGWRITDSTRSPSNAIYKSLFPNLTEAEYTATGSHQQGQDFLSNGFKMRNTNNRDNKSGESYLFLAFAESPFKYSNAR